MPNSPTIIDMTADWFINHPEIYYKMPHRWQPDIDKTISLLRNKGYYVVTNIDGEYAVSKSPNFGKKKPTQHEFVANPRIGISGVTSLSGDKKSVDDLWQKIRHAQVEAIEGALDKELARKIFLNNLQGYNIEEFSIYVDDSKDIEINEQ